MFRRRAVLPAVLAMALIGVGGSAVAGASPPSDGAGGASCTYTLSPPQRVRVSGVDMVTATVTPYPCTGSIVPNMTVACVQRQDSDSAPECAQQNPQDAPAQVYLSPYIPGATYVSTGRGCGSLMGPGNADTVCQTLGPSRAVL
jgi:hypothetical protein